MEQPNALRTVNYDRQVLTNNTTYLANFERSLKGERRTHEIGIASKAFRYFGKLTKEHHAFVYGRPNETSPTLTYAKVCRDGGSNH